MIISDEEVLTKLIDENRERMEREARLDEPLDLKHPTHQQLEATMAAAGHPAQNKRFCWLRGRRHSYVFYFVTGTHRHGQAWRLCTNCSHPKRWVHFGERSQGAM